MLLPVGVSVVITAVLARAHPYNLRALLLVTGVSLVYFGGITVWEAFSHPPTTAEIIVVTTTLTVAVIFEPVRAVFQSVLERRTHVRDDVPRVVVEAITARLREEIDLDQVRETFLDVIQRVCGRDPRRSGCVRRLSRLRMPRPPRVRTRPVTPRPSVLSPPWWTRRRPANVCPL